ncbi:hypothetical protein TNCV_2150171 [Trichonephila clavipes]|nr:hypothetical protein TNCV_2150171 [Trichonephila clavipes]
MPRNADEYNPIDTMDPPQTKHTAGNYPICYDRASISRIPSPWFKRLVPNHERHPQNIISFNSKKFTSDTKQNEKVINHGSIPRSPLTVTLWPSSCLKKDSTSP